MKPFMMPPKRSLSLGESSELKKKRKMLTVNEKVGLLDKLKAGNSYASVARQYGLNECTVRYIKKDEIHHSAVDKTVRLARLVQSEGFSDMTPDEITNLIDCHSNPLTDEDLQALHFTTDLGFNNKNCKHQ